MPVRRHERHVRVSGIAPAVDVTGLPCAGCFEAMTDDLRSIIRVAQARQGPPGVVILDGHTLQSTCESGPRAGYDGYERKRGSKTHIAVDTLGRPLAVHITPADEQARAQFRNWLNKSNKRRAERWNSLSRTQATPAGMRQRPPQPRRSSCRLSSYPRRRKASCFCRDIGWSNAVSAGAIALASSRVSTSVCLKLAAALRRLCLVDARSCCSVFF
ncbi:putative transposase IS4 [Burkholderia plantarii]|uniref:Putative transposase IS4 n=1 Tax=Burkholderia plantarii TaxID=41899 RepID=A0A0B6RTA2_BURPL|nr:putative transposase IS4 [Burkholderia plantarii]